MLAVGDLDDERDADWCGKESVVEVWRARTFWKRGGRWCPRLLRCDDATLAVVDEAGDVETSFELRDVAWAEDARRELSVAFRSRADEALVAFDDEASLRSWVDFVAAGRRRRDPRAAAPRAAAAARPAPPSREASFEEDRAAQWRDRAGRGRATASKALIAATLEPEGDAVLAETRRRFSEGRGGRASPDVLVVSARRAARFPDAEGEASDATDDADDVALAPPGPPADEARSPVSDWI